MPCHKLNNEHATTALLLTRLPHCCPLSAINISSSLRDALEFASFFTLTFDTYAPVFVGLGLKNIPGSSLKSGTKIFTVVTV